MDSLSNSQRRKSISKGILFSALAGAALFGFGLSIGLLHNELGLALGLPSLLLTPFLVGIVAAWFWRDLNLTIGGVMVHCLSCTLLAFTVAVIFFHEGFVCLLIIAPIYYLAVLTGALLGRNRFRPPRGRVNAYLIPALGLIVLGEPVFRTSQQKVVVDQIRIAAPPAKVWPHVLAFDAIPAAPDYWLFGLGLPYPTLTTNGGNFVGADRACVFSGNAVFKEKIAEFEPERLLAFDIVEMPRDPELIGHLDATRGEFELIDNHDGTTTLIGRTWYSLHVRPAFYFDWWTHEIFSAVHLRVMKNVQRLAEAQP